MIHRKRKVTTLMVKRHAGNYLPDITLYWSLKTSNEQLNHRVSGTNNIIFLSSTGHVQ